MKPEKELKFWRFAMLMFGFKDDEESRQIEALALKHVNFLEELIEYDRENIKCESSQTSLRWTEGRIEKSGGQAEATDNFIADLEQENMGIEGGLDCVGS